MMKLTWHNEKRKIKELIPYAYNPRQITEKQAKDLKASLERFGVADPIIINTDNTIVGGHQRKKILETLVGVDPNYEIDVRVPDRELTIDEMRELNIRLNKNVAEWDFDLLANNFEIDELLEWGFENSDLDLDLWAPEPPDDVEPQLDKAEELREKWGVESGQLWQLGDHRLICGDCTDRAVVERVMGGEKARMVFTDPPYGIGKDIINDNLKREDLIKFYRAFSEIMLNEVTDNAYIYVWGYFDGLSDYWQEVIKPRGDCNFRNFIIWRKHFVQGRNTLEFRQFPEEYEAALLFIYGMPFQSGPWSSSPNAEYYPETFEKIRAYLDNERKSMGWDVQTVKKIVGHSDLSGDHWFGRSQWTMPTEQVYNKLKESASGKAFCREYDDLRKEYDNLRGYFDNSNGFTDLWELKDSTIDNRHPTVKPIEVCERGIISTSANGELVLDVFLGSGSTLIACERLGRKCRAVEISPAYVGVTLQRYLDSTGKMPELISED